MSRVSDLQSISFTQDHYALFLTPNPDQSTNPATLTSAPVTMTLQSAASNTQRHHDSVKAATAEFVAALTEISRLGTVARDFQASLSEPPDASSGKFTLLTWQDLCAEVQDWKENAQQLLSNMQEKQSGLRSAEHQVSSLRDALQTELEAIRTERLKLAAATRDAVESISAMRIQIGLRVWQRPTPGLQRAL